MTPRSSGAPSPERWRVIEETLQRALDVEPAARAAFLAEACAGDHELRREVESLIAATPRTAFLERPVLPDLRSPTGAQPIALSDPTSARYAQDVAARLAAAVADRYTVERELGRGGMAMVFLARDLRHRRHVAIKVLYPELSAVLGVDRFLKEIELTASLQHPHILPLYDSGSADGLLFYVMPWVEGETLRMRLARERHLPVGDALRIAGEVADALTYAHARNVIHRDIKPENILLQGDHAVVADFGIALAVQQAGGERMTRTGLSLGTPQYMAPEQAMGDRVVDARADVYALSAVTYEMLAGEAPFAGPTAQAVVARLLTESVPPIVARRPTVPAHVERAVRCAMERIAADRFPSAAAFAAALNDPSHDVPSRRSRARPLPLPAVTLTRHAATLIGAGALGVVALAAAIGWWRGRASAPSSAVTAATSGVMRFAVAPESLSAGIGAPALSPDGRTLVYEGRSRSSAVLFARQLDELTSRPLKGTDYGESPFFSPDGEWIVFSAKQAIWRVRLDGGAPELVARLSGWKRFTGGTWGSDDVIRYSVEGEGLFSVAAGGGEPSRITTVDSTARMLAPHLIPGMQGMLVTLLRGNDNARIGVVELPSGVIREIGDGSGARYAAGHIVFARRGGDLFRQQFDLATLQPVGAVTQIERGVDPSATTPARLATLFTAAPNGAVAYRALAPTADADETQLLVTDRLGRVQRQIPARTPWSPRLSPDGRRVAYGAFAPGRSASNLFITDLADGTTQQLTDDDQDNNDPQWSPDGGAIAYSALVNGGKDLFVRSLGGPRSQRVTSFVGAEWPSGWTNDGEQVLFTRWGDADQRDLWIQPVNGGAARPITSGGSQETGATVSPDGRWLLYQSDESGRPEIYVESFPTRGRKERVSLGGGVNPRWRGDGKELYYWQDDQLVAVPLDARMPGQQPSIGVRLTLFRASYTAGELPMYDVSRDGSQFVLVARGVRPERLVVAVGMLAGTGR